MNTQTNIANTNIPRCTESPDCAHLDGLACSDPSFRKVCRMVDISCLAMFLRACQICYFTDEERSRFLEFQNYVSELETECFNEAGFSGL